MGRKTQSDRLAIQFYSARRAEHILFYFGPFVLDISAAFSTYVGRVANVTGFQLIVLVLLC